MFGDENIIELKVDDSNVMNNEIWKPIEDIIR